MLAEDTAQQAPSRVIQPHGPQYFHIQCTHYAFLLCSTLLESNDWCFACSQSETSQGKSCLCPHYVRVAKLPIISSLAASLLAEDTAQQAPSRVIQPHGPQYFHIQCTHYAFLLCSTLLESNDWCFACSQSETSQEKSCLCPHYVRVAKLPIISSLAASLLAEDTAQQAPSRVIQPHGPQYFHIQCTHYAFLLCSTLLESNDWCFACSQSETSQGKSCLCPHYVRVAKLPIISSLAASLLAEDTAQQAPSRVINRTGHNISISSAPTTLFFFVLLFLNPMTGVSHVLNRRQVRRKAACAHTTSA